MGLVPLPVWKAVDEDDAVLHQGLGSDQLVVGGIVDHINDPGLACAALRAPREVTNVQPQSTVLLVATADPHRVDTTRSDLCVCRWAPKLILSLLVVGLAFTAGLAAFMPVVP